MKKVLIIGAGIGQVPLCELCKKRGYYVIVATIQGPYPCIEIADKVCYVDIYDKEEIVKMATQENVDAVISDQNDLMMPTVAFVAEKLNLPGNTVEQTYSYCNKNKFRSNCDLLSIPVPQHIAVSSTEYPLDFATNVDFPWIIKPEDSQSSIGVSKVNSKDEYKKAVTLALAASKNNSAIVEEFFVGQEVVVEGFVYDGVYYNLGIADRVYFNLSEQFIPSQTIFPSVISGYLQHQLIEYEKNYASYVHPKFGIIHSEYLINTQTQQIRVVESAIRGGGVYISSHLIPLYCGININEILLDCALGYDIPIAKILSAHGSKSSAYVCFYLAKGRVDSIKGLDIVSNLPCVKKCDVNVQVGQETCDMRYKGDRLGPILLQCDNRSKLEEEIKYIQHTLQIKVNNNGEKFDIIWE